MAAEEPKQLQDERPETTFSVSKILAESFFNTFFQEYRTLSGCYQRGGSWREKSERITHK